MIIHVMDDITSKHVQVIMRSTRSDFALSTQPYPSINMCECSSLLVQVFGSLDCDIKSNDMAGQQLGDANLSR